jgi:hypothetical protein
MIRLFLDGCRILGALAVVGLCLIAVIAAASLFTRALKRKP